MKFNQNQIFDRSLVGYDLRKAESLGSVHMTSYDEDARFEAIYDLYESQLSGLNLFSVDPSQIPLFALPKNGRVIAFDLPTSYVVTAAKGNVSLPPMLPWFAPLSSWKFLGFDLVDPRTQISALDMYLGEISNQSEGVKTTIPLNEFGLICRVEVAERALLKLESKYVEHSPLVPCGVWLKEH